MTNTENISNIGASDLEVSLLTGGGDKPYALGLVRCLNRLGMRIDFIGSDELDLPELRATPRLNFLNLRGDQRADASFFKKAARIVRYYLRLARYAASTRARLFHILWNNRFEFVDRTALMFYYRLMGKRIVFTAHNVNARKRDANDSYLNRLSLVIQYRMADHILVHTAKMKQELIDDFAVAQSKISIIPLGMNNTVPITDLSVAEAKRQLGIAPQQRTLLFFGRIAPYKGLEYLIEALAQLAKGKSPYRLLIAGSIKDCDAYWEGIQRQISSLGVRQEIIERIEFIPDEDTELYFKAADALVLPYTEIFQSGVLVLAYSFGLPVIAADVGSLAEDVIEGETGFIFERRNTPALVKAIELYFSSSLYQDLDNRRAKIRTFASERFSWDAVGEITRNVYLKTLASQ